MNTLGWRWLAPGCEREGAGPGVNLRGGEGLNTMVGPELGLDSAVSPGAGARSEAGASLGARGERGDTEEERLLSLAGTTLWSVQPPPVPASETRETGLITCFYVKHLLFYAPNIPHWLTWSTYDIYVGFIAMPEVYLVPAAVLGSRFVK